MTALPAAREPGRYRIGMVCLGNICRSPMADVVLATKVAEKGWDNVVEVASCGTGDWHIGHPIDDRAGATLTRAGYDPSRHRAQQYSPAWRGYDVLLAMDESNLADLGGRDERVLMFREFDPDGPGEVSDPYYGGDDGFEEVLAMVERTSTALLARLPDAVDGLTD